MATVRANDQIAYSPHLLLMSAVLAMNLPTKKASVSIILIMNNIFIRSIRVIRVQKKENHPFGWLPIVGGPTACTGTSGALPDVMFSGAYPPVSLSL